MIFVANLENSKVKVKFEDSSKLKNWIGEFSGMMFFFGAISQKKLLHACACQNGNEFGVSLELTPNSKKICVHKAFLRENMPAQGLFKLKKAFCTLFFWVWRMLQTRGWVWSALQSRGLSLEHAPNSRFEFGVRSKLGVYFGVPSKRWQWWAWGQKQNPACL